MIRFLNSPWLYLGLFVVSVAIVFLCQDRIRFWITSARRSVANTVLPFAVIAEQLRIANDLKVLELGARLNPKTGEAEPIIPITEVPGRNDTEILWGVEPDPKGVAAMRASLAAQWEREAGDDEDE